MSAAAAARAFPREVLALTPAEFKERTARPEHYTETPNAYFDTLPAKCSSLAEYAIIGKVIRRTYGGKGRPRWTDYTAKLAAEELKITIDGAEKAFLAAEAHGFLEARELGRKKYYRPCPEKFPAAPDKEERKLERKPAAIASEPHTGYKSGPVLLPPGERTKWIPLTATVQARYTNETPVPISVFATEAKEGVDFAFREAAATKETKGVSVKDTRTAAASVQGENKANDTRTRVTNPEFAEMRQFLARWAPRLPAPDEPTVRRAVEIKGTGDYLTLAGRLRTRLPKLSAITWELVLQSLAPKVEQPKEADGFKDFLALCTECELPSSRVDIAIAEDLWNGKEPCGDKNRMTFEDRIAAMAGLRARKGSFEFSDPAFRPQPDRYLFKRTWERPIRQGKQSQSERDRAAAEESARWAREMDEKMGRI